MEERTNLRASYRRLKQLLILEPGHLGHLESLAKAAVELGAPQEAAVHLARRAESLARSGAYAAALADIETALGLAPGQRVLEKLRTKLLAKLASASRQEPADAAWLLANRAASMERPLRAIDERALLAELGEPNGEEKVFDASELIVKKRPPEPVVDASELLVEVNADLVDDSLNSDDSLELLDEDDLIEIQSSIGMSDDDEQDDHETMVSAPSLRPSAFFARDRVLDTLGGEDVELKTADYEVICSVDELESAIDRMPEESDLQDESLSDSEDEKATAYYRAVGRDDAKETSIYQTVSRHPVDDELDELPTPRPGIPSLDLGAVVPPVLLSSLAPEAQDALLSRAERLVTAPGNAIVVADAAFSGLHVVTCGRLILKDGGRVVTWLEPGEILGTLEWHDGGPWRLDAVAEQACELRRLPDEALKQALTPQAVNALEADGRERLVQLLLARHRAFARVPAPERVRLAARFRHRGYAGGSTVVQLGEPLEGLYLVGRGRVAVYRVGLNPTFHGPGEVFGVDPELGKASFSANASPEAELFVLPRPDALVLLAQNDIREALRAST